MPSPLDNEEYTRRLLTLIAEGHPVDAVARQLEYSERAIRRHVRALCDRTGCRSYTHLAVWATRHGLAFPAVPPVPRGMRPINPGSTATGGGGCTCPTRIAS